MAGLVNLAADPAGHHHVGERLHLISGLGEFMAVAGVAGADDVDRRVDPTNEERDAVIERAPPAL
jgi:hypothetical protein